MKMKENSLPSKKLLQPVRQQWNSSFQFMLATISYAVGLGNIWRFPALAYENGGFSFLVPYLFVSFIIGFPLLYLELSLGQYARAGPAVLHGRLRPAFQGIGWGMIIMVLFVGIYYNLIVAWSILYLFILITGRSYWWSSCFQEYNSEYCYSEREDLRCTRLLNLNSSIPTNAFFFNKTCYSMENTDIFNLRTQLFASRGAVSPAEEFFENYVLEKTETMDTLGGINYKILICYAIAWIITAICLRKGVKLIGKLAYFTATVPYAIIAILFVRSITLDGAKTGMDYFILKPDFSRIFDPTILRHAATHICYSLSIGSGGIHTMASYNPPNHNAYKTAAIITAADGLMSFFGGISVFSILGFMSSQLEVPIGEVVQSGVGLAFVAYPEAMSRLPLPWLWSFLFFLMIWILGISTQFGFVESICTAIQDQFPSTKNHRSILVYITCFILWCCGIIMCTRAGIFYFNVFNDYTASFGLMLLLFLEIILVCHIYGIKNYIYDLRTVLGVPRNWIAKFFGPTGYYPAFIWTVISPIVISIIFFFSLFSQLSYSMTYGKGTRIYIYPGWSIGLGWLLSIIPLLFLPGFIIYNVKKFNRKGLSWKEIFRLQAKWPSFPRHQMYGTGGVINSSRVWVTDLQQSSSPSDSPKQTRL